MLHVLEVLDWREHSCQQDECHAPHLSLSLARAPASEFSLLITLLPVPVEKLLALDAE
jgi:hypothetical protein